MVRQPDDGRAAKPAARLARRPLSEGERIAWPPPRADVRDDVTKAAVYASILGWHEADWQRAQNFVVGLLGLLKHQYRAVSGALLDHGALSAAHVEDTLAGAA